MDKDITRLFNINDFVSVKLNRKYTPRCVGSESQLIPPNEGDLVSSWVLGTYKGSRPGMIKVRPVDLRLLGVDLKILEEDPEAVRYVTISESQIEEIYLHKQEKVFP